MRPAFRLATRPARAKPTLLVIGAQKLRTTSLRRYLSRNPAVLCAEPKETRDVNKHHARGDLPYRA